MSRTLPAVALLVIVGCGGALPPDQAKMIEPGPPPPVGYEDRIRASYVLKDPYSAVWRFAKPRSAYTHRGAFEGGDLITGWIVSVCLNAKNAFGAYTGEHVDRYFISNGLRWKIDETLIPMPYRYADPGETDEWSGAYREDGQTVFSR